MSFLFLCLKKLSETLCYSVVNKTQNQMERKLFFILEKDFLNTREVGDLIEVLGPGGVGAYMAILIYLHHQPAYTTCYRPSLLSQLARCNNGTVELFRDVL